MSHEKSYNSFGMRVVIFDTPELQERGLQHKRSIEEGTLFVFPLVTPGVQFHSRNVPESFDLIFIDYDLCVLEIMTIDPPFGVAVAPDRTYAAIESKAYLLSANYRPGMRISF